MTAGPGAPDPARFGAYYGEIIERYRNHLEINASPAGHFDSVEAISIMGRVVYADAPLSNIARAILGDVFKLSSPADLRHNPITAGMATQREAVPAAGARRHAPTVHAYG